MAKGKEEEKLGCLQRCQGAVTSTEDSEVLQVTQAAAVTVSQFASLILTGPEWASGSFAPQAAERNHSPCWNTHCCCIQQVERTKDEHHFGHQADNLPVGKMYGLIRGSSTTQSLVLTYLPQSTTKADPSSLIPACHHGSVPVLEAAVLPRNTGKWGRTFEERLPDGGL